MRWILNIANSLVSSLSGRSHLWPGVRRTHLKSHPECNACGTRKGLQVHHIVPVHVDRGKELDPTNLVTLCDRHHFALGHLEDWSSWNFHVIEDSYSWKIKLDHRPRIK